jgi:hypothetical protein
MKPKDYFFVKAIRELDESYITPDMVWTIWDSTVVVLEPNHPPLKYNFNAAKPKWEIITFTQALKDTPVPE